jgi:Transcriptional repressor TCF25
MSSRALRRLQKELELERQLAAAGAAEAEPEEEDDREYNAEPLMPSKLTNAFDMLDGADGEESEPSDGGESPISKPKDTNKAQAAPQSLKTKKKKKKSKKKAKERVDEPNADQVKEADMDEIDRALKDLSTKDAMRGLDATPEDGMEQLGNFTVTTTKLLGIDSKHLNPLNEMKSLFGNIALEPSSDSRSSSRNQRRREQNLQGGVDLATALRGEYSPASKRKSLGAMASRRNVFMQGKEEWPLSTSGGLSMERTSNASTLENHYSIIHNNQYQQTQHAFRICVESMDPQNMIQLLIMNPYHIATLLQVSEIAKHQGDHSVSGDLLERALFSFGRSVHSTFPAALREGSARVAFDKPANRELYLTIWRYMKNLEMRGTWRTAFEWAKLLLQLDPRSDPYGVTLMIDQLALRGRQNTALIELCSEEAYGLTWAHLPNIQISLALAYHRSSQPKLARQALAVAMDKYPYVLSALASSLDITPIPSSLWGKLPSTDAEKLYTELYVTQAKDLWNTPETTSLISEVAQTLDHYSNVIKSSTPAPKLEISLEEARHIMLLEIPQLLALLPRRFTNMPTSSSDVLPPPNSLSDFTARAPANASGVGTMRTVIDAAAATVGAPISSVNNLVDRVMAWFLRPAGPDDARNDNGESEGQVAFRLLNDALGGGYPPHMIEEILRESVAGQIRDTPGDQEEEVGSWPLFARGPPRGIGDFDYYLERAEATSDEESRDEDDDRGMPDLESISGEDGGSMLDLGRIPHQHGEREEEARNLHATTVEDAEDESDGSRPRPATTTSRSILRHIDSDDEDDEGAFAYALGQPTQRHPQPTNTAFASIPTAAPSSRPSPSPQSLQTADGFDITDPQRVQRWLLSGGLSNLQSNPDSLGDYVEKLKSLRKQQQEWVVSMVKQRAGAEVAERIMGRLLR